VVQMGLTVAAELNDARAKSRDIETAINAIPESVKVLCLPPLQAQLDQQTAYMKTLLQNHHGVPTLAIVVDDLSYHEKRLGRFNPSEWSRIAQNKYRLLFLCSHTLEVSYKYIDECV